MTVTATIDMAAPPSVVRTKFLDFASLSQYHTGFFGSITPLGALEPGNKIRVHFAQADQTIDAVIKVHMISLQVRLSNLLTDLLDKPTRGLHLDWEYPLHLYGHAFLPV